MKLIIISDIHGDADSTNAVIAIFNEEKADKIVILGDILYHGPRNDLPKGYNPKEVIRILNEYKDKIIAVRGNCDAEVDQMVLNFPIMDKNRYIQLDNNIRLFLTHGHHYNEQTPPKLSAREIIVHGHTHIPKCTKFGNDNYCLNPGSISIPKNGYESSYMIYENRTFTIKDFLGNTMFNLNL